MNVDDPNLPMQQPRVAELQAKIGPAADAIPHCGRPSMANTGAASFDSGKRPQED